MCAAKNVAPITTDFLAGRDQTVGEALMIALAMIMKQVRWTSPSESMATKEDHPR